MAVEDTWTLKDGKTPSRRHGRGLRYRVRWRGVPSKSFRTLRAAERHWLKVRTEEPQRPGQDVTVGELVDRWAATKADLSHKGRESVDGAAKHVRSYWQDVQAADVLPSEVRAWVAGLHGSASLRIKILQCLSGSYRLAVQDGLLATNPCEGVTVRAGQAREPRYLTVEELARLADACDRYRPMVWLLGTTGLRIGEACALNVGDVAADRGRLRVRTSKTGVARDVPVSQPVLAQLDLDRGRDEPLFLSPAGRRVSVRNWRARVFTPGAAAAGLPGLHVHDLRHTGASMAIASGADIKAVQQMLGHKSAVMTLDLYGHLWDTGLDDVAARIGQILGSTQNVPGSSD